MENRDIMQTNVRIKVTQGGRIVIPAEMRRQLGIEIGEDVNLSVTDDEIKISTSKTALENIRRAVRLFKSSKNSSNHSVVDELIAERRKEAENE